MNLLSQIFQIFKSKPVQKKVLLKNDIKFSALIQNIQKDVIEANESLECVGRKYIEKYFEKTAEINKVEDINHKLDAIEKQLDAGDVEVAKKLIIDLKDDVTQLSNPTKGDVISYRPKMDLFEIPVLKNGAWLTEEIMVPSFTLSPIQIPKIKELTFTSKVQNVQHEGDDVYVRFMRDQPASKWRKSKTITNENVTELKISINPEQSCSTLNDVITHYEQVLRSH
ncbi:MAG: hypothetical protein OCD00_08240 [Colwellia sp.]